MIAFLKTNKNFITTKNRYVILTDYSNGCFFIVQAFNQTLTAETSIQYFFARLCFFNKIRNMSTLYEIDLH